MGVSVNIVQACLSVYTHVAYFFFLLLLWQHDRVEIYKQRLLRRTPRIGESSRKDTSNEVDFVEWIHVTEADVSGLGSADVATISAVLCVPSPPSSDRCRRDMLMVITSKFTWHLLEWCSYEKRWNHVVESRSMEVGEYCSQHSVQWPRYNAQPAKV